MTLKSWFDNDSEVQFTSYDSDTFESTHDFSEDSNGIIPTDQARHHRRSESCAPVHQFTASISGLSCAMQVLKSFD
jgi:hypothetical protein